MEHEHTLRTDLPRPMATVDVVVLSIAHGKLAVALSQRGHDPFQGKWALPGGVLRINEDASFEAAARRVMAAKLGPSRFHIEQLATFSGPDRDPDGWAFSVAHLAVVPPSALSDIKPDVALFPIDALPPLAFDHGAIVDAAVARLRGKGAYSSLPAALLGDTFTLVELEKAYEIALGASVDTSSFRRKIRSLDLLESIGAADKAGPGRPPMRYRLKGAIGAFNRTLSTGA